MKFECNDRAGILGKVRRGLVKQLVDHGYSNSKRIEISAEQVALAHSAGVLQVELGEFRDGLDGTALAVVTGRFRS